MIEEVSDFGQAKTEAGHTQPLLNSTRRPNIGQSENEVSVFESAQEEQISHFRSTRGRHLSTVERWKIKAGAAQEVNESNRLLQSQQLSDSFILSFDELFKWPASIEQAEIHERANSLGKITDGTKKCPCCLMYSERERVRWCSASINNVLGFEYGTAVPCLFYLIIYYLVVMILLCCIMSFFYLYQSYVVCN